MTITAQTAKTGPYSGNGSTVDFDFTFYAQRAADLVVTLLDAVGAQTTLTLGTDYTVTGVGVETGGTITVVDAPAVGEQLVITRSVELTQETDLQNLGEVSPEELEAAYDKLTQIAQDHAEELSRSIKVDRFGTTSPDQLTAYINALGPIATDISAVANIDEDVVTLADNISNITTVAGISANVTTVAGISSAVTSVAGNATNINTVATNIANVNTVATNIADVTNFADVYLGARSSAPTVRTDGSALEAGDLYFNTVGDAMWVYDGAAWVKGYARGDAILDSLQFTGGTGTQGTLSWNADEETLDLIQTGATLQIGQETQVHVRNNSGVSIAKGTPVMATGTLGASGRVTVAKMVGSSASNAIYLIGLAGETIANGEDGKVVTFGKIRQINTTNTALFTGTIADGDVLYIDPVNTGKLTNVAPAAPDLHMHIAFVIHAATNGTIMVRVTPINENEFQPYTSVLAGTTAAFTTTLKTKLDGIETAADVTDAANVATALGTSGAASGELLSWTGSAFDWVPVGGTGTVTSVALSAPTGFAVTGSPVVTAGTLSLAYAAGYQGYTSVEATFLGGVQAQLNGKQAASSNLTAFAAKTAPSGDVVGTTDTQALSNKTLASFTMSGAVTETVYAITGTTPALSAANGTIQTWTLTANSTPTSSLTAGQSITLMIDDGPVMYTVTWPSVTWKTDGGSAPTLNTTGYTAIVLWRVGAVLYGARVGDA